MTLDMLEKEGMALDMLNAICSHMNVKNSSYVIGWNILPIGTWQRLKKATRLKSLVVFSLKTPLFKGHGKFFKPFFVVQNFFSTVNHNLYVETALDLLFMTTQAPLKI